MGEVGPEDTVRREHVHHLPVTAARLAAAVLLTATLAGCATGPEPSGPAAVTPATTASPATPPAVPAPRPGDSPLAGTTVLVDPGHNGGNAAAARRIARPVPDGRGGTKPCNTTGASSADGYAEHAFTWAVSQRLAAALRARGVRVVMTRDDDTGVGPCVDERGTAGERAGADAVVSVHADGAAASGSGFHVLYSSPPVHPAQGAPARSLADATVRGLRSAGFTPADYIGRGGLDARDDIAGLDLATVPSVLVECANLRNAGDAATARSADGQQRYADALADATTRWLAGPRR